MLKNRKFKSIGVNIGIKTIFSPASSSYAILFDRFYSWTNSWYSVAFVPIDNMTIYVHVHVHLHEHEHENEQEP